MDVPATTSAFLDVTAFTIAFGFALFAAGVLGFLLGVIYTAERLKSGR